MFKRVLVLLGVMCVGLAATPTSTLMAAKLDKTHSRASFTIKYLLISELTGQFSDYDAQLTLDDNDNVTAFEAQAELSSIDTQNVKRDKHLQRSDYFSAKKYPTIVIKMVSFEGAQLVADVTIRDVTKRITFTASFATAQPVKVKNTEASL